MNDERSLRTRRSHRPPRPKSASLPSAEEFASASSKATVFLTNVIQALLVACVVLWVLDVPAAGVQRLVLYRAVADGLPRADAGACLHRRDAARVRARSISAGAIAVVTIADLHRLPLSQSAATSRCCCWVGLGAGAGLDLPREPAPRIARWFDWLCAVVSLLLCGYIAVRYEPLTYELAMLPVEGIVGSAILIFLVLEASRRISGWGFVAHHPGDGGLRLHQPAFCRAISRPAGSRRSGMVAYLGLDVNGMIGAILQVAVLIVIPFTILGQVLARTGGADFFSDIAMSAMGRFRGGAAKIAVVGSALFGMISGSAVSNVLAVGIVTIPTMIKSGFSRYTRGRDRSRSARPAAS